MFSELSLIVFRKMTKGDKMSAFFMKYVYLTNGMLSNTVLFLVVWWLTCNFCCCLMIEWCRTGSTNRCLFIAIVTMVLCIPPGGDSWKLCIQICFPQFWEKKKKKKITDCIHGILRFIYTKVAWRIIFGVYSLPSRSNMPSQYILKRVTTGVCPELS